MGRQLRVCLKFDHDYGKMNKRQRYALDFRSRRSKSRVGKHSGIYVGKHATQGTRKPVTAVNFPPVLIPLPDGARMLMLCADAEELRYAPVHSALFLETDDPIPDCLLDLLLESARIDLFHSETILQNGIIFMCLIGAVIIVGIKRQRRKNENWTLWFIAFR
jgi:hypothetical protein